VAAARTLAKRSRETADGDDGDDRQAAGNRQPRLKDVLDTIPVRVFWKDRDGRYLGCNLAFARDAGLDSPDQLIGRTDYELAWREQAPIYRRDDNEVMSLGQAKLNYEEPQTTPDGRTIWLRTSKIPLRDDSGNIVGILGTYEDITEKKNTELALIRSEENLRITLESIGDGVVTTDLQGRITRMNRVAETLTGWAIAEARGRPLAEVLRIRSTDSETFIEDLATRVIAAGEPIALDRNTVLVSREGREHRIADSAAPILAANGAIEGVVVVFRDVSAEVEMEERLLQSRKLEAVARLAGGVAHDLNNTLATVIGNVAIAKADPADVASVRECLEEIESAARRAVSLVQKIVTIGGGRKRQPSEIDVGAVVDDVVHLFRSTVGGAIEVHLSLPSALPAVLADPSEIRQIVMNLLENARDAIGDEPGRIDVSVERIERGRLPREAAASAGVSKSEWVRIRVSDTGHGMDPEVCQRVFEPFFTTRDVAKRPGLGLSVVHGIVTANQGMVSIESEPEKGTRVDVFLPVHDTAAPSAQDVVSDDDDASPVFDPGDYTILYVDDDEPLVFLVRRILNKRGYRVVTETSPVRALEHFRRDPRAFDVVVTDHNMPEMSGVEFAREIAAIRSDLPIIMVSGYLPEDRSDVAEDAGVCEVVYKPDTVDHLIDAIEARVRERA
ncbi:MAG: PAS domain S-box protein, partial [Verrucomicrobia bacterium]